MKKIQWTRVDDATFSDYLPRGGYVIEIVDVEDHPEWDALSIVFDVAEGQYAGKFKDLSADDNWRHRLRQGYGANQERFFKGFLTALEKSNPGFDVSTWEQTCDERQLIGLKVGAVITYSFTINNKGNLSKNYSLARAYPVDKIRNGDYTVPDDYYSTDAKQYIAEEEAAKSVSAKSADSVIDAQTDIYDIPF